MMSRRFACEWKSRLPHKEHNMCRFKLHLRSFSYRNPEKTTDLLPQVIDKLHHKHLCCITSTSRHAKWDTYLSPFNVYYISLTGYHILAHIVTDMCYNMFKLTSTFLGFKKMHGIATVLFKVFFFYTSNDVLEGIEPAYGINKRYVELHSYPWPNSLNHIFENKC